MATWNDVNGKGDGKEYNAYVNTVYDDNTIKIRWKDALWTEYSVIGIHNVVRRGHFGDRRHNEF